MALGPVNKKVAAGRPLGEHCARRVQEAREAVQQRALRGRFQRPSQPLRMLSDSFDALLKDLFEQARPDGGAISLVALGGYGRRSLYPHSDIDILLLADGAEVAQLGQLLEQVVYPLWDARVSVGHAARSIEETVRLADEDLTMRTSLLDARLVAGAEAPFAALREQARRELFSDERLNAFIEALRVEREQRHPRFGDTIYLLEPNIKSGSGGLRDVNTAVWAAKACFGVNSLDELAAVGAATTRQQAALLEARELLRRLRIAMHLHSGRAQDRLLFELQEAIAPVFFPHEELPGSRQVALEPQLGVAPTVEKLMHAYYRAARTVVLESEGILQRCAVRQSAAPPSRVHIDDHFWAVSGRLVSTAPERFWEQPSEIVRAFSVASAERIELDRELKDVVAEAVAGDPGAQLMVDDRAAELWRRLLCDPERSDGAQVFEQMHEVGVLNAMIPEFEPCTGRVQHDLYHVYTVDRHTLYVLAMLKALRRGDLAQRFPLATQVMAELEYVEPLYLAALLHDIAKPRGRGHARKGGRLAAGIAARLGLSTEAQAEVVFLVRQHLAMPHVSQRRDLSDPSVMVSFAQLVGSTERLRCLYLLALADSAMTAPDNLTHWKASLLDQLYTGTYRQLTSGSATPPREVLSSRRAELGASLAKLWGERGPQLVQRLPDDFVAGQSVEVLAHHAGVVLDLETSPQRALRIGTRQHDATHTVLTVCCPDAPGLLSTITGVMLLHRINVLSAQVYTLPAAQGDAGVAMDIFWVTTPDPAEFRSWDQFAATLERALGHELALAELVAQRIRPSALPARFLPRVPTEVLVDNQASERCTIFELHAADVLGLLHAVTHKLTELGWVIDVAKLATEAGRVIDIFYVRDATHGLKVTDTARLDETSRALERAVEELLAKVPRAKPPTLKIEVPAEPSIGEG